MNCKNRTFSARKEAFNFTTVLNKQKERYPNIQVRASYSKLQVKVSLRLESMEELYAMEDEQCRHPCGRSEVAGYVMRCARVLKRLGTMDAENSIANQNQRVSYGQTANAE